MTDQTSRRELLTNVAKALPLAAVAVAVTDTSVSAAPKGGNSATAFINSAAPSATLNGFIGTISVTGVQNVNGVLTATASMTGNIVNSAGAVLATAAGETVTAAVTQVAASCQILNLVLGPLDLNLLGLTVHLNQVVLNIAAVPGAGNLLGNLLCAVANLLNGGGALTTLLNGLVNLLNQILGQLGG